MDSIVMITHPMELLSRSAVKLAVDLNTIIVLLRKTDPEKLSRMVLMNVVHQLVKRFTFRTIGIAGSSLAETEKMDNTSVIQEMVVMVEMLESKWAEILDQ